MTTAHAHARRAGGSPPQGRSSATGRTRIDALDGLRAFALLIIMGYHFGVGWLGGGFFSLDIFYVLSGYLITGLLLGEYAKRDRIDLPAFWLRRARRLLPALLVVLVVVTLFVRYAQPAGLYPDFRMDALSALFYFSNWWQIVASGNYFVATGAVSPLTHTWSLAVEEQFYLVWPLVVLAVLHLSRTFGRGLRVLLTVSVVGAVGSAVEMALLYRPAANTTRLYFGTDTHAQSILVGAVLACVLTLVQRRRGLAGMAPEARSAPARVALGALGLAGLAGTVALTYSLQGTSPLAYRGGFFLSALSAAALIAGAVTVRGGPIARLYSLPPLVWIGTVSYGAYLWHYPVFIQLDAAHTGLVGLPLLAVRFAVTLALAGASFTLIERPVMERRFWRTLKAAVPAAALVGTTAAVVVAGTLAPAAAALPFTASPARNDPAAEHASLAAAHAYSTRPVRFLLVGDSLPMTMAPGLSIGSVPGYGVRVINQGNFGCDPDPSLAYWEGLPIPGSSPCLHWRSAMVGGHRPHPPRRGRAVVRAVVGLRPGDRRAARPHRPAGLGPAARVRAHPDGPLLRQPARPPGHVHPPVLRAARAPARRRHLAGGPAGAGGRLQQDPAVGGGPGPLRGIGHRPQPDPRPGRPLRPPARRRHRALVGRGPRHGGRGPSPPARHPAGGGQPRPRRPQHRPVVTTAHAHARRAGGSPPQGRSSATGRTRIDALDGLRAFALLIIMGYHFGVGWLGGGFFSLDIFYVLSGYLITGLLLGEYAKRDRIDLPAFWLRRARRLLPALLVVLVVVTLFVRYAQPAGLYPDFRMDALSALFYFSNWWQIVASGNYFVATGAVSPLTHTWSLAVEEQFYLVWPLVVLAVLHLSRTFGRGLRVLLTVSVVGAVGSAVEMALLYRPAANTTRLYFGTDTHAQSILVGAVLACVLTLVQRRRGLAGMAPEARSAPARVALGALGLAGLAGTVALTYSLQGTSPLAYRGGFFLSALSAAALIAGAVTVRGGPIARLYSLPPLVWIGTVSYGAYLWHYPVFIQLDAAHTGLVGLPLLAVRFAVTLALAGASFTLIERPVMERRFWRTLKAAVPAAALVGTTAAVVVAGTLAPAAAALPSAEAGSALPASEQQALAAENAFHGDPVRFLLLGDSLGVTLGVGLQIGSVERYGVDVINKSVLGCDLDDLPGIAAGHLDEPVSDCRDWPALWASDVAATRPEVVGVLVGRWDTTDHLLDGHLVDLTQPAWFRHLEGELDHAVSVLSARGARVVFLTLPYFGPAQESPDGSLWPEDQPVRVDDFNRILRDVVARHPGVASIVDLNRMLDPDGHFTSSIDGVTVRWADDIHISKVGGEWLQRSILPTIAQIGLDRRAGVTR